MSEGMGLLVFPVEDAAPAKTFYGELLGVDPYVDAAYYVGFRTGDLEIGLDPNGRRQGLAGPLPYWAVDDIEKRVQALVDGGAQLHQDVTDVGGGKLTALVKDPDGNLVGLVQSPPA